MSNQPALYSIHIIFLKNFHMLFDSYFSPRKWTNGGFYTPPGDPVKIARALKETLVNHTEPVFDAEIEYSKEFAFISTEDYLTILSVVNDMSDEENWDINRKIFTTNDISIDCILCLSLLDEYKQYFSIK